VVCVVDGLFQATRQLRHNVRTHARNVPKPGQLPAVAAQHIAQHQAGNDGVKAFESDHRDGLVNSVSQRRAKPIAGELTLFKTEIVSDTSLATIRATRPKVGVFLAISFCRSTSVVGRASMPMLLTSRSLSEPSSCNSASIADCATFPVRSP
jgi:hypothetical protein